MILWWVITGFSHFVIAVLLLESQQWLLCCWASKFFIWPCARPEASMLLYFGCIRFLLLTGIFVGWLSCFTVTNRIKNGIFMSSIYFIMHQNLNVKSWILQLVNILHVYFIFTCRVTVCANFVKSRKISKTIEQYLKQNFY